jgi:hypothetical protein
VIALTGFGANLSANAIYPSPFRDREGGVSICATHTFRPERHERN